MKRRIAMPSLALNISFPFARSVAIAALMSTTMLATPLTATRALAQAANTQNPAAAGATHGQGVTVEQRITDLHAALKITPDEETLWNAVAQAMRENAAAMDKLIASTRTTPPQNMSAMDDLNTYQNFTQAHLDGLKNLTVSFGKLYAAMPDAQKKVTDDVFQSTRNAPPAIQTAQAAAPHRGQGYMVHDWDGHHHHHWWGHDSEADRLNQQELNRLGVGR